MAPSMQICRLQQHFELSTMHWQFVSNVFLEFGALNMETSTDADCTIDYLKMYFKQNNHSRDISVQQVLNTN